VASEDLVRKINALLRIAGGVPEPEKLEDDEWGKRWQELKWAAKSGFLVFKFDN
jgi:hypothetical protein